MRTEIDAKTLSVERFQRMIFGAATEKTETVLGEAQEGPAADSPGKAAREKRAPGAGHGRNAASAYTGARRVKITHPTLSGADICPGCSQGKVYPCAEAAQAVRIEAMAPLSATVYERERLRCNLCGEGYTAPAPAQVGEEKYDETVPAMIGMLKYGAGLPFNRIERHLLGGPGVHLKLKMLPGRARKTHPARCPGKRHRRGQIEELRCPNRAPPPVSARRYRCWLTAGALELVVLQAQRSCRPIHPMPPRQPPCGRPHPPRQRLTPTAASPIVIQPLSQPDQK